jgi:hypothetical protein
MSCLPGDKGNPGVRGINGKDGEDANKKISSIAIKNNIFTINFSDNTSLSSSTLSFPKGEKGAPGKNGDYIVDVYTADGAVVVRTNDGHIYKTPIVYEKINYKQETELICDTNSCTLPSYAKRLNLGNWSLIHETSNTNNPSERFLGLIHNETKNGLMFRDDETVKLGNMVIGNDTNDNFILYNSKKDQLLKITDNEVIVPRNITLTDAKITTNNDNMDVYKSNGNKVFSLNKDRILIPSGTLRNDIGTFFKGNNNTLGYYHTDTSPQWTTNGCNKF